MSLTCTVGGSRGGTRQACSISVADGEADAGDGEGAGDEEAAETGSDQEWRSLEARGNPCFCIRPRKTHHQTDREGSRSLCFCMFDQKISRLEEEG